jgi:hypothetical protein
MAKDMQKNVIEHAREDIGAVDDPRKAIVAAEPPKQSFWDKVADHIIDRMAPEIGDMLKQKFAQGAAELAQAINSQSNAYVPYGAGQQSLEVQGPQQSWAEQLREASQRGGQERDQGMER